VHNVCKTKDSVYINAFFKAMDQVGWIDYVLAAAKNDREHPDTKGGYEYLRSQCYNLAFKTQFFQTDEVATNEFLEDSENKKYYPKKDDYIKDTVYPGDFSL